MEDLADDAVHVRHLLESLPIDLGRCERAATLELAIAGLREGLQPDVVFLDLTLPDARQLEAIDLLLAFDPNLVVIVMLDPEVADSSVAALEAGAHDYVLKSDLSAELLARVMRFALYRRRSHGVLASTMKSAEEAVKAKVKMLSKFNHELRTPMNAILGFTELFRLEIEETADPRRERWLGDVESMRLSQQHLLLLMNELLDLAKIEAGQLILEPTDFSPAQLFEECVDAYRNSATEKGNALLLRINEDVPEFLSGDAKRIRTVVNSLLNNANKFTHDGTITVAVHALARPGNDAGVHGLEFRVSDTGAGIPAEELERIFDEFHQVGQENSTHFGGLGLGLTICRQLCRLMGGDVQVASVEGNGSAFTVRLSLQESGGQSTRPGGSIEPARNPLLHERTAIVVEDDEAFRQVLTRSLEYVGIKVSHFASAEEAELSLLEHPEVDIVLVDLHLPGKNGIELVRNLRRKPSLKGLPAPKVIVATGDRSQVWRDECEAIGGAEILLKPFSVEALCEKVLSLQ